MSIPIERWKDWEGRLVDGKFPLRRWLGSSDHSVVFLTERSGGNLGEGVIKIIGAENFEANPQLSLWAEAAKLLHPHLLRLFACGRCTIDDAPLLYAVMEYAEENLGEIIPVRALSADEALEVFRPAAEALSFLHSAGFVHSRIKPSNIVAVGNQLKLSSDGLRKPGQTRFAKPQSAYDAPEVADLGFTSASDIWSLGATLLSVLTQKEPAQIDTKTQSPDLRNDPALQQAPERVRELVRLCLQVDPAKRISAEGILQELSGKNIRTDRADSTVTAKIRARAPLHPPGRRLVLPILALAAVLLAVLLAGKFMGHSPSVPASEAAPRSLQADNRNAKPSTVTAPQNSARLGVARGSVLKRAMPDVSRDALHTIKGRIKVGVEVSVDSSGNVSGARLASSGPSKYFSSRSLAAARQWKFNPAQLNGEPTASEWLLRFQFGRGSTEVFPTELNP